MQALTDFFDKNVKPHVQNLPKVAWLNIVGGLCVGIVIGVPPMLIYFQSVLSNCLLATSEESCGQVVPLVCSWESSKSTCLGDVKVCNPIWGEKECNEAVVGVCGFNSIRNQCEQTRGWGWTNSEVGFFATIVVVGATIGSYLGSLATTTGEQLKRLSQSGVIVCVGGLCAWGCWLFFTHSVMLTGFCLLFPGLGLGGYFSLANPVVSSHVPAKVRTFCGTLFQLGIVFGICFAALLALIFSGTPAAAPHILFLVFASFGAASFYVADSIVAPIVLGFSASDQQQQQQQNQQHQTNDTIDLTPPPNPISAPTTTTTTNSSEGQPQLTFIPEDEARNRISNIASDGPNTIDGLFPGSETATRNNLQNQNTIPEIIAVPPPQLPPQTVDGPRSLISAGSSVDDMTHMIRHNSSSSSSPGTTTTTTEDPTSEYYRKKQEFLKTCYLAAFVLASGLQLTGINAIMTASPKITVAAGIKEPLVGNFIIMLVNALACIPAIPLASRFPATKLYLFGLAGSSLFCFLTAGAMLLESPVLSLICVCCYLILFESCQGPMFFTVATEIFPPGETRSTGAARCTFITFSWNIVVNALYPSLCDWMMPIGDHSGGVRRVFILFGCLGVTCLVASYYLFPKTYLGFKSHESPPTNSISHSNTGASAIGLTSGQQSQQQRHQQQDDDAPINLSSPSPVASEPIVLN